MRDPSESMSAKIFSNAFSNATSFCNSVDDGVKAVSKSNASFRTGSRISSRTFTSLDIPSGAVKIHSCVLSGLAVEIREINWSVYNRE